MAMGGSGSQKPGGGVYNFIRQDDQSTGIQFGNHNVVNVQSVGARGLRSQGDTQKPKVKKPKKIPSRSLEEPNLDQLDKICKSIDKYKETAWKELGEKLGLTCGEIEAVEHDHCRSGMYEMCYQMLRKWKERQPTPPQIKILSQALCDIGRGDLSDTLAGY